MPDIIDTRDAPQRLIFYVLLVFVLLNLFLPGESSPLTLILSQVVIFGFAGLYTLFIRPRAALTLWSLPALFFGLAFIFSQYASMHGYDSLRTGLQLLSMVLLAWLVSDVSPDRRGLLIALGSLVATAAVLSAVGLIQIYTFFGQPVESEIAGKLLPVDSSYLSLIYSQKRIFSTFVLPTSFSVFLATVFPIAVGMAIQFRKRIIVLACCCGAIVLMALAMLQAQSNGGPVSLALGGAAAAVVFARDRNVRLRWVAVGALVIGLLLIAGVGLLRGNFLWDLGAINSPIRLRWNLWMATLAMISRHGLFGIGAGNFEMAYFPFVRPDVRPTKFAHNTYLQIPLEFGVLGAIALIIAFTLLVRTVLRRRQERQEEPVLQYGLVAAAGVFLVANAFEIVLYFHSLGLFGALILGLLLKRGNTNKEGDSESPIKTQLSVGKIAATVACGAAVIMLGRWFLADHYYDQASVLFTLEAINQDSDSEKGILQSGESGDKDVKGKNESFEQYARTAISIDPGNYRYHFLLANILDREGGERDSEALSEYAEAVRLCPRMPYLHYNFGVALARKGSLLQSAQEIAEAARLYPSNGDYQNARAIIEERFDALLKGEGQ